MSKKYATITGVHGYVPDYVLTNKELETMVDTNDEWIQSRTGIKERRILKKEGCQSSTIYFFIFHFTIYHSWTNVCWIQPQKHKTLSKMLEEMRVKLPFIY